jgi:hypothetical protein
MNGTIHNKHHIKYTVTVSDGDICPSAIQISSILLFTYRSNPKEILHISHDNFKSGCFYCEKLVQVTQ